jgi:hypothetical protein
VERGVERDKLNSSSWILKKWKDKN